MLEDLQLFEQNEAGRIWWRFEHRIAAIIDRDRRLLLGREGFKVARTDQASGRVETSRKPPPQSATVEGFWSIGRDLFESTGEVGLDDQGAKGRCLAIG